MQVLYLISSPLPRSDGIMAPGSALDVRDMVSEGEFGAHDCDCIMSGRHMVRIGQARYCRKSRCRSEIQLQVVNQGVV